MKNNLTLSGIFNISSTPISKHELLQKLSNAFDLNVDINENKNIKSNKVLISKKFTEITGINPPNWDELIEEFKLDCEKFKSLYKKLDYETKVMTIVGTRPEIIKLSRVIHELDKFTDHILVHTGQNYDYELNEIFLMILKLENQIIF